jgi:hypothetical protein
MPILGIIASSKLGVVPGDFESIATTTVGSGGVASVTFSSIPATYTHLQIRGIVQLEQSGEMDLQFNSDTAANYSYHRIYGSGSSVVVEGAANTSQATVGYYVSAASIFNGFVIDILDYANTSKYKTIKSLNGTDTNGGGLIVFDSSSWRSTSAITSIKFFSKDISRDLNQYSSFALYGIRSA